MNAQQVAERSAVYALDAAVAPMAGETFDLLATAPQGVAKLRELILSLAVQGKLVPAPHGEAQGSGWQVVPLKQVFASIRSGGTPSKQNPDYWGGDIAWASVKDLGFGNPIFATEDSITDLGLASGSFLAKKGSVLICTRMGLGKIGKAEIDVAINQDLKAVELADCLDTDYFINFFKTLSLKGSGMTVAGIKQSELLAIRMPLPPLAEQHRIVARVEELMGLCDELETHGRLQDEQHERLVATLFDTLVASASPAELADNWQRTASHFDLLLDRPEAVDALEQTILQLAVRGLLVPQDPIGNSALTTPSSITNGPQRAMGDDALPFSIPHDWNAVRLGNVTTLINGDRGKGYPKRSEYVDHGLPFINTGHIRPGGVLSHETMHFLTRDKFESLRSGHVQRGDLVYCLRGATLGKTAIVDYEEGAIASSLVIIRPGKAVYSRYLYYALVSPFGQSHVRRYDNGSAQPNLAAASVRRYAIPLPPLAEQHRIVARVDELRSLCADLRQHLQQAQATQATLADAMVARAAA